MSGSGTVSLELRTSDAEALDITPFVERFTWTESMLSGGFSWELHFRTEFWREWDRLMLGRDLPNYQMRLLVQEQEEQSTEWRSIYLDKSRAAFSQNLAMTGQARGADRRLELAQGSRTRRWTNVRVSDIISQIASEHGLLPDVEQTSSLDDYTQARENDWAFARRVARAAALGSGRGDVYLWMDERTLRLRAPQLTARSARSYDIAVVEERLNEFVGTYYGREADRQGAATLRGVGFDFDAKAGIVFEMNPGTAQTQPSLASRVPRRMADGLRVVAIFQDTKDTVVDAVRARWCRVAPRYMSVTINTRPDVTISPGVVISIEANLDQRRETPWVGRYVVLEVRHTLVAGTMTTSLVCYRREAHEGESFPTGASADLAATQDPGQRTGQQPRTTRTARQLG